MNYGGRYASNATMQLIGKQILERWYNEAARTAFNEILEANNTAFLDKLIRDTLYDVFVYGCITGVREERQRKKATTQADNLK